MLKYAISEINITPEPGLLMAGMLNPPLAEGARWPLFARAAVFSDEQETACVISLDLLFLVYPTVLDFRQAIAAASGLKPENIMISCTHTHRAPYVTPLMDEPVNYEYLDFLKEQLCRVTTTACAALKPARLKMGHIQAPGWTWNRRPVYKSSQYGEQVGTQGPCFGPEFLRMEGPEDNEIVALLAETTDGQPIGGIINFACHATVMGAEPYYSADYPGALVEILEKQYGGPFLFIQGAAGNLWALDKRQEGGSNTTPEHFNMGETHNRRMALALAEKATEALENGVLVQGDGVRVERKILSIPQRQPTRDQVDIARWYLEERPADINEDDFTRRIYGHDYTFYGNSQEVQQWFCREMVAIWEWQRHQLMRVPQEPIEIQAIAIGEDLAFIGYPAEYFTEFGLETKAKSPFQHTLVSELANGWGGYVPTREAFTHGGYECRLAYQSRLIPEAGEVMCRTGIGLLRMLSAI